MKTIKLIGYGKQFTDSKSEEAKAYISEALVVKLDGNDITQEKGDYIDDKELAKNYNIAVNESLIETEFVIDTTDVDKSKLHLYHYVDGDNCYIEAGKICYDGKEFKSISL